MIREPKSCATLGQTCKPLRHSSIDLIQAELDSFNFPITWTAQGKKENQEIRWDYPTSLFSRSGADRKEFLIRKRLKESNRGKFQVTILKMQPCPLQRNLKDHPNSPRFVLSTSDSKLAKQLTLSPFQKAELQKASGNPFYFYEPKSLDPIEIRPNQPLLKH